MKRLIALTVLAAFLLALPAPAASAKKRHRSCNVHGSSTVAINSQTRVYYQRRKGMDEVRACRIKTGKSYLMSSGAEFESGANAALVTLSGPFVAYALNSFDDTQRYNPDFQGFANDVVVKDIRTGISRSALAVGSGPGSALSLVLDPNGSIAWIGVPTSSVREVRKMAAGGAAVLLDSGPEVKDSSLALGGGIIYWMKGSAAAFAAM